VVTVVREENAYEQPVSLGVSTKDEVQCIAGLNADDWVAIEGDYGLPAGCPVRITPEPIGENTEPAMNE
jgi:hypothetical protein